VVTSGLSVASVGFGFIGIPGLGFIGCGPGIGIGGCGGLGFTIGGLVFMLAACVAFNS
jgi:hypothetical protein